jgi:lipoate-protein ligase A
VRIFDLGHVPWQESQLVYHALPRAGIEGLVILAPAQPYVCIGWHQDVEQEVDLPWCRAHSIPVFRREVGGGAVYLDGRQVFFQLVLRADNPAAQGGKGEIFRRMLAPVVAAYGDLGVHARYRPTNDVLTAEGRKISGTGAAEIGDFVVVVGNLIEDFDYETMSRVLRVPDEKFRGKLSASLRENLTTLRRETGRGFAYGELAAPLARRFAEVLGPLEPAPLPPEARTRVEELRGRMLGEEWLHRRGRRTAGQRDIRVGAGVNVVRRLHKAPGGLLRATLELREEVMESVELSGDFFCYPRQAIDRLERLLAGTPLRGARGVLEELYRTPGLEVPGVAVTDWLAVLGAPAG